MSGFDTWDLIAERSGMNEDVMVECADNTMRTLAVFVDIMILIFFIVPAYLLLGYLNGLRGHASAWSSDPICMVGIGALVFSWLYFAGFESSRFMATPGKMLAGILVIDQNGKRITFLHATGRFICKLIVGPRFFRNLWLYDEMADSLVITRDSWPD